MNRSNKKLIRFVALQGKIPLTPSFVPSDSVKSKCYRQRMPTVLYLVWLLWIVNQHTFFGCQEISGTEDIRHIIIEQSFEPLMWSWPSKQQPNFYTKHSSLWWCTIWLNLVAKRSAVQQIWWKQSYLFNSALTVTLTRRQQTNLLAWHFGPWCSITIPSLVTEGSAAEEISSRWTFTGILKLLWPWSWPQQDNSIFSQDNPPYNDVPSNQV